MRQFLLVSSLSLVACSATPVDVAHDAGFFFDDATAAADATHPTPTDAGNYPLPDGGGLRADRFVTSVVSFSPGDCAGFGVTSMPSVVEGPPEGGGSSQGSTDVVSLGRLGTIVLGFAPNAIVDGPGPDFVVFENAFWIAGNSNNVYAEPGEVSVSEDGVTWSTYPCTSLKPPYGACSGVHPVLSSTGSGISPIDFPACGGEAYDLADLGLKHARFVRIHDIGWQVCPTDPSKKMTTNGFDLDAIAIVNAEQP